MNNSEIIANLLLSEGEGKIGNIHENAEQIIINYMEKREKPGYMTFTLFEASFDSVSC